MQGRRCGGGSVLAHVFRAEAAPSRANRRSSVRGSILCGLLALCGLSLPAGTRATQLPLTAYDQDSGLSSLSVIRLQQDRQGFVWVGTEKGLYRFEGVAFNQVGAEQGFTVSEVVSLAEDAQGRLWVGSRAGLQLREHDRFGWVRPDGKPLQADRGQTLAPTADGGMLLISGHRLQRLVPDGQGQWRLQALFGDDQLKAMPGLGEVNAVFHRDGTTWFGCGEAMCRMHDGRLDRYGPERGIPADKWLGILGASDGSLWVRGIHTVRRLAVGADAFVAHDLPGNQTEVAASSIDLVEDERGHVLTRSASGLARWDGQRWELFGTAEGIPTAGVSSLLADRDGSIWIGTYGRGLLHWSGADATENWTAAQGLGTLIWSVARDRSGAIWVADDWGINIIDPAEHRARRQSLALPPPHQARAVLVADDGAVWFFLFDGRVLRRPPSSDATAVVATLPFLVRGAYLDRTGRFWAYTLGGLYSVDAASGKVERAAPEVIPSSMCADLAEDGAGRLWLACSSGLYRHAGGRWTRVRVLPQESLGGFENVAVTPDGRLWLSSLQPGLLSGQASDADAIRLAPVADALLADSRFYFLRTDHQGRLWAGGNSGVDVLEAQRWTRLSSHDGLLWDETNHGAFHADVDGSVWIGSPVGLSHLLRPRQLLAPRDIRPLLLSARYAGRELAGPDPSVPFDASGALVLRLAAVGNSSGSPVHFRYRLSGIDKDWVETTSREVRYASLPHGSYRFELQTIDVNQRRASAPTGVDFSLQPPWWRTAWAYAAMALLALAALMLAWRWRVRVLVVHAQRLEQAVAQRTGQLRQALRARSMLLARISHDLRTPLAGIIDGVRQWRAGDRARDYPQLIEHSARMQLDLIDELLEFSRGELDAPLQFELVEAPGYLHAFLRDLEEQARWLAERQANRLDCRFADDLPALVKADFRRLRQVLINLLGNAAKFTRDGHIQFIVGARPAAAGMAVLRFVVQDDGIGIDPASREKLLQPFARGDNASQHDGSGLGLAIVTQLLERMGSRLQIEAVESGGSRVGFELQLPLADEDELDADLRDGVDGVGEIDGGGHAVLVVDDQPQSRDMLCDLLDSFGFDSLPAADGGEALELLRRRPDSLVLTDQRMPGMDGWALLQAVRRDHPGTPVLLYSSLPPRRPGGLDAALAFDAALLKPASARQLLDAVGRLLKRTEHAGA
ncbi:hypothetical protein ASG87_12710 [Frateuria sp. Soil773]|uniref:hybrid sensor histidine kinase/response regulator n=1 Tax=Frateuria sp. Soil773 TaxID=1736407 RepID=UPI0006F29081|nr:hybrid sensor histidine kinase/response regulator [Frateuria sp. Soil773]KRF00548.1 hypothetical protein ASG87_12710 [Frateuria sp. Soil773]